MPRPTCDNPNLASPSHLSRLKVSKLDVIKREIETCSDLYFAFGDLVSTHVLINAAHEILRVYDTENLGSGMIFDYLKDAAPLDVRKLLGTPYTFFKHGKMDLKEIGELLWGLTEILMVSAIAKYEEIEGKVTPKMSILHLWIGVHHRFFTQEAEIEYKADWIREHFPVTARDKFRDEFLPPLLEVSPLSIGLKYSTK